MYMYKYVCKSYIRVYGLHVQYIYDYKPAEAIVEIVYMAGSSSMLAYNYNCITIKLTSCTDEAGHTHYCKARHHN
jgi:hypothetical protein